MKIKLLGNRILIKRIQAEKSDGGILLPDKWTQSKVKGLVIEVGNGVRKESNQYEMIPLDIMKGDIVICSKFDGSIIKIDDEEYWILNENEILVVLKDE